MIHLKDLDNLPLIKLLFLRFKIQLVKMANLITANAATNSLYFL